MKKTVAITVNFLNYQDTIGAVKSLMNQSLPLCKIIVVDNYSPNESISILEKTFSSDDKIVLLKTPKNGGYAYGVNYGIRYAMKNFVFDYFLIINNDTISDYELNKQFTDYFESNSNSRLGLLTGKILFYDDPKRIWYAGGYFNKKKVKGSHYGGGELDRGQHEQVKEITFATGCVWFFKRSLIDHIGLLPEEYFMYYEDVDFSLKVQQNNYKIHYIPSAVVFHKVGKRSSTNVSPSISYKNIVTSNIAKVLIARKYLTVSERLVFAFWLANRRLRECLDHLIRHRKLVNTFRGIWKGLTFRN